LADLQAQDRVPQLLNAYQYSINRPDLASPLAAMLATNSAAAPFFTAEEVVGSGHINQVAVAKLNSKPWLLAFFQPRDALRAPVPISAGPQPRCAAWTSYCGCRWT